MKEQGITVQSLSGFDEDDEKSCLVHDGIIVVRNFRSNSDPSAPLPLLKTGVWLGLMIVVFLKFGIMVHLATDKHQIDGIERRFYDLTITYRCHGMCGPRQRLLKAEAAPHGAPEIDRFG